MKKKNPDGSTAYSTMNRYETGRGKMSLKVFEDMLIHESLDFENIGSIQTSKATHSTATIISTKLEFPARKPITTLYSKQTISKTFYAYYSSAAGVTPEKMLLSWRSTNNDYYIKSIDGTYTATLREPISTILLQDISFIKVSDTQIRYVFVSM